MTDNSKITYPSNGKQYKVYTRKEENGGDYIRVKGDKIPVSSFTSTTKKIITFKTGIKPGKRGKRIKNRHLAQIRERLIKFLRNHGVMIDDFILSRDNMPLMMTFEV